MARHQNIFIFPAKKDKILNMTSLMRSFYRKYFPFSDFTKAFPAIVGLAIIFVTFSMFTPANNSVLPATDIVEKQPAAAVNGISNEYKVTRVVDGDTIAVEDRSGKEFKVRLIGMDTPETVDPRKSVECFGEEASRQLTQMVANQFVRMEDDPTQDNVDRYGRLLRYVYLLDGTFINKEMIVHGYAYEYTYQQPYQYQQEFKQAQSNAQKELLGLWSEDTCNGSR